MSENNNTTLVYESQPVDLNLLSVLDVTAAGKVVSAETWKELWDLVLNRINKFDTYCVEVCNSINALNDLNVDLKEASIQFYNTAAKLDAKFNALKTGLVHYGKSEPENQNIAVWVQPVAAGSDSSVDAMVIAHTDAVLSGIVDKRLTDLNCSSLITSAVNTKVNGLKLVGKRGAVSSAEVFNNYNDNKAMAKYTSASGNGTIAGTCCFSLRTYGTTTHVISNYDSYAKSFASNTQRLICVGDEYIILTADDGACVQRGVVSKIKKDTITVTPSEYGLPTSTATGYWFILLNKPFCGNTIYGSNARASGLHTMALADNARSAGYLTKALAMNATAEGSWTVAMGAASHAEGRNTVASGVYSHVEGRNTKASGSQAHAEGSNTLASNFNTHAEGNNTQATKNEAHAEGLNTTASGSASHAEGEDTTASSYSSHAEGGNTTASGYSSHAEGENTTASGGASHAEGGSTVASDYCSHAEGRNTKASGPKAHAEGEDTTASGYSSHAEGGNTVASGGYSHAGGLGTIASGSSQTSIGKYNREDDNALLIVGNGSGPEDENRSNAFTVNENGTATVQSDPVGNMDVATKQYVEQFINDQLAGYSLVIHSLEEQITALNTKIGLLTQRVEQLEGGV